MGRGLQRKIWAKSLSASSWMGLGLYLAKQLVEAHGARSGWSGQSMAGRGFGSSRTSRHARPEAADDATPPRRGLNPASVRLACALRNPIHSTTNEGASRQLPPCSVTRYQKRSFLGWPIELDCEVLSSTRRFLLPSDESGIGLRRREKSESSPRPTALILSLCAGTSSAVDLEVFATIKRSARQDAFVAT